MKITVLYEEYSVVWRVQCYMKSTVLYKEMWRVQCHMKTTVLYEEYSVV